MARTGLIYGESGTFKTTQIKGFARYIYRKTGKPIRLVSADLGGYAPCQPEVDAGLIIPWRVNTISGLLPTVRKLSKGFWPTVVRKDNRDVLDLHAPTSATWEQVGGYAFESLTSVGDAVMNELVSTGRKVAEEVVSEWSEKITVDGKEEVEKFGASARAHYNFVQQYIYNIINAFSSLPVEYVLFTALEAKAEEQDRTTIYGPAIAGKAATPKVPSWVGDCIHHDSLQVEVPVPAHNPDGSPKMAPPDSPGAKQKQAMDKVLQTHVRGYFMRHPDPKSGVNHPAKPRVVPEKWTELLKKWPSGYYTPGNTSPFGFEALLEEEDRLAGEGTTMLLDWKKEIDAQRKKVGG